MKPLAILLCHQKTMAKWLVMNQLKEAAPYVWACRHLDEAPYVLRGLQSFVGASEQADHSIIRTSLDDTYGYSNRGQCIAVG